MHDPQEQDTSSAQGGRALHTRPPLRSPPRVLFEYIMHPSRHVRAPVIDVWAAAARWLPGNAVHSHVEILCEMVRPAWPPPARVVCSRLVTPPPSLQLALVPPSHDAYGTLCVLVQRLARHRPAAPRGEVCAPCHRIAWRRGSGWVTKTSSHPQDTEALSRASAGTHPAGGIGTSWRGRDCVHRGWAPRTGPVQ
jgi:hypothetical protein